MRSLLIQETVKTLEEADFDILLYFYSCLDVAAQRKNLRLLVKVLENIDGFRKENADELKKLGCSLDACPLLIGETTKTERMGDGVLYDRHEIPTVTLGTLREALAGGYPTKISSQGRLIAEVSGEALEMARKRRGLGRAELAEEVRLTKESIYFYEKEKMKMKYEVARRIEDFLKTQIVREVPPFSAPKPPEEKKGGAVEDKLALFDFSVYSFDRLNFDLLAKDERNRIVVKDTIPRDVGKIEDFSDFFEAFLAIVSDKEKKDVPIIRRDELLGVNSKQELMRLLRGARA